MISSLPPALIPEVDAALREPAEDFDADPELRFHAELTSDSRRHATARPPRRENGR